MTKQQKIYELVNKANDKPLDISWGQHYFELGMEMYPIKTREANGTTSLDPRKDDSKIQIFIDYITN